MKKYFNKAIIIQAICLVYIIVHNYYFISQYLMFFAGILSLLAGIFLFWQCFTNKEIKGKQKIIGLLFQAFHFYG